MLRGFIVNLRLGWDDWTIIPTVLSYVVFGSLQLLENIEGVAGHHIIKIRMS